MHDAWLLFALIGATLIVVSSVIARPIRRLWPSLLSCSQCTGAWIGAVAGAVGLVQVEHNPILNAAVVGCAVSFLAELANGVLLNLLGEVDEGDTPDETQAEKPEE